MNPLGYVNIYWLREFVDTADGWANGWLMKKHPRAYNFNELDFFFEDNLLNDLSVNLFYEQGLSPAFSTLNNFQRQLIPDALAVAICADKSQIWSQGINQRVSVWYDRAYLLSSQPKELFQTFYDLLASSKHHSLSEFAAVEWRDDTDDKLDLYKYC